MKTLVFATSNDHKLYEIRSILHNYQILGLKDIDIYENIEETGTTLEENAIIKATFLYEKTGKPSFSEDTGLEVDYLDGAPGVHTARYAGENRDANANMDLLLQKLEGIIERSAQFRTVIAYITTDGCKLFEGIVKGKIATSKEGKDGFGYDPIFIPEGYQETFAVLNAEIKNSISHRAMAIQALTQYLRSLPQ